jgi:hypothetical protein
MRGSFRRDAELRSDPDSPGAFSLVRRAGARRVSRALVGFSLVAVLVDLALQRPWLALAQLALVGGFLLLHLFAEARSWHFASDQVVWRTLQLRGLRVHEEKMKASEISRVAVAKSGKRARAWLEMKSGLSYALVEGKPAEVEKIAGAVQRAVLLAGLQSKGQTLH